MTCTNTSFAGWIAVLAVVGGAAKVGCAGERVVLSGNLELRITVSDELRNPVTDNRFVQDEIVLVRATLSDLAALQAKVNVERRRQQVLRQRSLGSPERLREAEDALDSAETEREEAVRRRRLSPLRAMADQLTLTVTLRRSERRGGDVALQPSRLDAETSAEATRESVGTQAEAWWSLDSAAIASGRVSLQVTSRADETAKSAGTELELVSTEEATPENRCRAAYVKAQIALEASRFQEAADRAGPAAQLGTQFGYYRMASLHVLGDAHYEIGNTRAAIDAYRRAMEIAKVAFPKSRLPYLLGRRIRELENE